MWTTTDGRLRRTDDGPLVYYKLIVWAFGSGELKKKENKKGVLNLPRDIFYKIVNKVVPESVFFSLSSKKEYAFSTFRPLRKSGFTNLGAWLPKKCLRAPPYLRCDWFQAIKMSYEPAHEIMVLWYLSHRRPAKAQSSLRIRAVSPEPSLFAHMKYGSRRRLRLKTRHLALLDGCACAFEEWVYAGRKVP